MFSFIDTELRLHDHPSLTPSSLVRNVGPLVNVHGVMWHALSSLGAMQVKFCMWGTSSRIVSTQKLEVLPLVIHTVNHLFEVTVISDIFHSFFFFLKVCQIPKPEYPQSVQSFSQVECCLEKQNKTKWINLQIKKKAVKTQTKTNNKNPTSSTYNSNSCCKLCLEVTTVPWQTGERVLCISCFTFHPKEY